MFKWTLIMAYRLVQWFFPLCVYARSRTHARTPHNRKQYILRNLLSQLARSYICYLIRLIVSVTVCDLFFVSRKSTKIDNGRREQRARERKKQEVKESRRQSIICCNSILQNESKIIWGKKIFSIRALTQLYR